MVYAGKLQTSKTGSSEDVAVKTTKSELIMLHTQHILT